MIHFTEKTAVLNDGRILIDFELDAYAQLDIEIELAQAADLEIFVGEVRKSGNEIDREPGGFRIIRSMQKCCPAGRSAFEFELPRHKSPYQYTKSVPLPPEAEGREITPFRYVEINGGCGTVKLIRKEFYGNNDDDAAHFICDSEQLNRIWEFCKYTMKATGAFGIYIDGERERQPYEGDAVINQLGDFCCGGTPEIAKRTIQSFLTRPTFFTEWLLCTPILVRDYLLYTGDEASVKEFLPQLEKHMKTFVPQADGLLHDNPFGLRKPGGPPLLSDLIDWPRDERDNYEMGDINLVPNCYYYNALRIMAYLTGNTSYDRQAEAVREAILKLFYDPATELFRDSEKTSHTALHSALYPAAFGIVPAKKSAENILRKQRMQCSVYTAQYLLEFCFDNQMTDHAFDLLLSNELRSYSNMLAKGATIAMEAWDNTLKPNQDWNHAWGAAPANTIPRCIAGIRPLEPGFRKFSVTPHPGPLKEFYMKHPTPAGSIELTFRSGKYELTIPDGLTAVSPAGVLSTGSHQWLA